MKGSNKRFAWFAVTTVLIFAGVNLPFVISRIPENKSSPPCIVGMTGWLWVNLGTEGPYVERVFIARLAGEILFAACATWILSKALRYVRRMAAPLKP